MFLISAIKHTPIGLKTANFVSWVVIIANEKISEVIDFLSPDVAQALSLYGAFFLSVTTAVIAIRKEYERSKKKD